MAKDSHMLTVRKCINEIIDRCAVAAEVGGPQAVLALKIAESAELPPGRGVVISDEYVALLATQTAQRQHENG